MGMHDRRLGLGARGDDHRPPHAVDTRCEPRHGGLVERATIIFRDEEYVVPVINISSRGTMIAADIAPRIGESVTIRFNNCTSIHGFVRWARDGRLGLNFGHEMILGL